MVIKKALYCFFICMILISAIPVSVFAVDVSKSVAQEELSDTPSDKHVIMSNIKVLQTSSQSGKILFLRDLDRKWNDYSDLAGMLDEKGFTILEQNINPITLDFLTCYEGVVFSPLWESREINSLEAEALANFVQRGGRLLLIGEHGGASFIFSDEWDNSVNKVGKYFNISFDFAMVCDPTDHYLNSKDPDGSVDAPFITDIGQHEVTEGVSKFMFSSGTALQISDPAIAVAYTDSDAWLDTNYFWNSEYWVCTHDGFAAGRFPVLAVSRYGSGKVVAIGDSSIFTNSWLGMYDHYNLAENIFEWFFSDKPDQEQKSNLISGPWNYLYGRSVLTECEIQNTKIVFYENAGIIKVCIRALSPEVHGIIESGSISMSIREEYDLDYFTGLAYGIRAEGPYQYLNSGMNKIEKSALFLSGFIPGIGPGFGIVQYVDDMKDLNEFDWYEQWDITSDSSQPCMHIARDYFESNEALNTRDIAVIPWYKPIYVLPFSEVVVYPPSLPVQEYQSDNIAFRVEYTVSSCLDNKGMLIPEKKIRLDVLIPIEI